TGPSRQRDQVATHAATKVERDPGLEGQVDLVSDHRDYVGHMLVAGPPETVLGLGGEGIAVELLAREHRPQRIGPSELLPRPDVVLEDAHHSRPPFTTTISVIRPKLVG